MGLPSFSAEASLYRTSGRYYMLTESGPLAGAASAALMPYKWTVDLVYVNPRPYFRFCGKLGERCCRAPEASQNIPAFGPLVSCDEGLGCDITTNTCVPNCGKPGQPCCDGPETRAPKWTADGKAYSPNNWYMKEMCEQGACDRQSHRCFVCGMQDGAPCCPPDAAQATARCRGENLTCEFDSFSGKSGICHACGKAGREPCDWGCEPGLGIRGGLCDYCGGNFQVPCDNGCQPGLGTIGGFCRNCGDVGEIPCDFGCKGGLRLKNGLCAVCGNHGQQPCDTGCVPGTVVKNGLCTFCGGNGQVPCANGWCNPPMKVAAGLCRYCGARGQMPCDAGGCNPGLIVSAGGTCIQPPLPEQNCAQEGQSCVADFVTGKHCCKSGGPLLCVYGNCKACIPRGQPCGKNQTCCTYGDVCMLDIATETEVCGIPG